MSDDPTIAIETETPKPKTARERLAELEAEDAKAALAAKQAEEEANAEQELANREIIARLKKEHAGEPLRRLDFAGVGMVVVTRASDQQYRNFRKDSFDESKRADAQQHIVIGGTVYPPTEQLEKLLRDFPGMTSEIATVVDELSGGKVEAKKV